MVNTYANVSLESDSGRLLELFANSSGISDRFPNGRYSFRKLFGIILDDFFIVEVVIPFYLSQKELPLPVVKELIGWHKDRRLPIPVELSNLEVKNNDGKL